MRPGFPSVFVQLTHALDPEGVKRAMKKTDRLENLYELAQRTPPGPTAEAGVYRGASSYMICAATDGIHHLFDSFEGLSRPDPMDALPDGGFAWPTGHFQADQALVEQNLREFAPRLRFHKGWIPSRFLEVSDVRFAFVHIDVDLAQPTLDSISFFYDRMLPSGIIVSDDYASTKCPGARQVLHDFMADKPEQWTLLPPGPQAYFIRSA